MGGTAHAYFTATRRRFFETQNRLNRQRLTLKPIRGVSPMNPTYTMSLNPGSFGLWPLFFAKETDQDLDFDDSLDDMDDQDPQPPSRRPLVLILLLLVVAGVGYFMMDPGALSSLTSMITAPASKTPATGEDKAPSTAQPPVPSFQEGQLVAVMAEPSGSSSLKLTGDAQGKQPGPSVKAGELLTILDGALVNNTWIYLVHTKSGASGWIGQHQLKAQS